MVAVSDLEFQVHYWIKTARHAFTALSIVLAIPAFTVVILCAHRTSTKYALLIAGIVVLGVFNDIVLNLVWDPLMLLPDLCIMREKPPLPIPGGPNFYYAVQQAHSRFLLPSFMRHIIMCLFALGAFLISTSLSLAEMDRSAQNELLNTIAYRWPSIDISRAMCYDRFPFICFAVACISGLVFCAIMTALASWHTFASLKIASTLSESVRKNNASLTKLLIVQSTFPFILIGFPLIFCLIALLEGVGGPLTYSLTYLFVSAHSPTHSLILLTITPMYRRKFVEVMRTVIGSNNGADDRKVTSSIVNNRSK